MSSIRNPVGPESATVYWRRRLVLGVALAATIVVVLLIVFRPGGAEPAPVPTGSTTLDPATGGTTTDGQPSGEVAACMPTSVRVVPIVDANTFANGEEPLLSMEITNIGAIACSYDVGTRAQEYIISSGSDRIWSSADCALDPTENVMALKPDQTLATTPFAWDRTRSTAESCEGPEVIAGGASYHLNVRLGEAESEGSYQFILN